MKWYHNADGKWSLKDAIKIALGETIRYDLGRKRNDWFDEDCQQAIIEKNITVRSDPRANPKHINDEMCRLNDKFEMHNLRSAYKLMSTITGGFQSRTRVPGSQRKILPSYTKQLHVWATWRPTANNKAESTSPRNSLGRYVLREPSRFPDNLWWGFMSRTTSVHCGFGFDSPPRPQSNCLLNFLAIWR